MLILDENWNWRRCGAVLNVPPGHRGNDPDGQIRLVTCNIDVRNCAQKQNKEKMQDFRVLVSAKRCFLCTSELGHLSVPEGLWKLINRLKKESLVATPKKLNSSLEN